MFRFYTSILCIFLFVIGCTQNKKEPVYKKAAYPMVARITRIVSFNNIPSASGLEIIGNQAFILSDDSPYLYMLDVEKLELRQKFQIFNSSAIFNNRIPKALKPDLESLTKVSFENQEYLLALGSGSAPNRNSAYLISTISNNNPPTIKKLSLEKIYESLNQNETITGKAKLNIEAVASSHEYIYLMQRATLDSPNVLITFAKNEFMRFITGKESNIPKPQITPFTLPTLQNLKAGFSGAVYFDNRIFFTASVENTADAFLDGEVLGSFVGYLEVNKPAKAEQSTIKEIKAVAVTDNSGKIYPGKIESLAILKKNSDNSLLVLAVTDNDAGQSEVLELEIRL